MSQSTKIGVGIASVLVPIVGIVVGILYMSDQNPEKKAAGRLWLYLAFGGMVLYILCVLSRNT